ncbi:UPF0316 protein [Phocicoccus schoeneichii]|uniref:UPF0316 protein JEOSCH030_01690 n=1 Tax=Phocicoccus schoeneichii TaxID=1812261 RepID=A0A6V7RNB7_9BACL|nr:DUF2179 domain-containing protein [Jeotgalicoccus schoeneichii]GGH55398.1 UPF0316 protein [Jeotgalicoccus schoeneichii]CAD2079694.1 hypothetical protein JEOSCH030_01690 [Jeotgalicoccus schoeneichii]
MLQAISENQWLMLLTIFVINIAYVSFLTMRTISTLKGYRYVAASLSVCETFIYIMGLGLVLDNLDKPQNIAAYAFGFGIGILLGIKIEEKLALGYLVVNAITAEKDKDLPMMLRDLGYGVTHGYQYGRDGERTNLQILTPRRYEKKLIATIKELDPKAFIISYEPRTIHGGFWTRGIRSRQVEQYEVEHVEEVLDEISTDGTPNGK